MPRSRKHPPLGRQAAELAVAVPQVVAHRLTRMALAGPLPNARDRREFHGMAQEKAQAFWQSWFGMGMAMMQAWQQAWLAVLASGMAPVHRKATANARRLARTSLR